MPELTFYASGAITDTPTLAMIADKQIAVLTSYAYRTGFKKQAPVLTAMLRERGHRIPYMLDSGAFTAWNKGKEVNRDALIDFYNWAFDEYGDVLNPLTVVSLDRIPGRQGVERVPEDFVNAARESVENYDYMLKHIRAGVELKPVFHDGDPEYVLNRYADSCTYLSLSANLDLAYWQREAWVAEMSQHPRIVPLRLHGLAMTGTRMLRTVSWHSVDSSAWALWAAYGAIAWLREDGSFKTIPASAESPRRKRADGHLATLPGPVRERILAALHEEGFTEEEMTRDAIARARWNILVFWRACEWASKQQLVTTRREGAGLFG